MSFTISKISEQKNGSFIFTDFYPFNNDKIAIVFHCLEPQPLYENAVKIALETFNKKFYNVDKNVDSVERLKNTALEINRQIYGFLTHNHLKKSILSSIFLLIKQDFLYLIQFGKIMVGVVHNGQFIELGNRWKEYNQQIENEIQMLGSKIENVELCVIEQKLSKHDIILAVLYKIAHQFNTNKTSRFSYIKQFNEFATKNNAPMLMIEIIKELSLGPSIEKKKFHLSARNVGISMVILAIIAALYAFFGKNLGEDYMYTGKEILKQKSNKIDFDKIDEKFSIATKLFLPQVYQPKLKNEWEMALPFTVSHPPLFDYENIYLIKDNKIFCLTKTSKEISWVQKFNFPIPYVKLLGNKYLLVDYGDNQFFCLNKDNGKIVWARQSKQHIDSVVVNEIDKPIFIDYGRDRRLQYLYFITKDDEDILLFNCENGKIVDRFAMKNKIKFISDYDYITKSIYVVIDNKLICLKLEIK